MSDQLPDLLLRKIHDGKVVLFLGSGVNFGCTNSKGDKAPLGDDLAKLVKQHFFPTEATSDNPVADKLKNIAMAVIGAGNSRGELEQFIYDTLIDLQPNNNVLMWMPMFKWRRIYTTNFDRLTERAYEEDVDKKQRLRPIFNSLDPVDYQMGNDLPYVKLHGCITRIRSNVPLILTPLDYANYESDRIRLFGRLESDLAEHTILFVGYSLMDEDFLTLLNDVRKAFPLDRFPRCYAIDPNTSKPIADYWKEQRIEILSITGEEFFKLLRKSQENSSDEINSSPLNGDLAELEPSGKLSIESASEIFSAFELVTEKLGYGPKDHENYYKGNKPSWSIILNQSDAKRTYYDEILTDLVADESTKNNPFELMVITGAAGDGKSTLLMRLAYDHALEYEGFCLYHKDGKEISLTALEELYKSKKKRLFLYIDDAADNISAINRIARLAISSNLLITIICAERKNEWSNVADQITSVRPTEYSLGPIDDSEIDNLLNTLDRNNYLCVLADKTYEQRIQIFKQKSQKQLLVAMREATEGEEFDKIIQDEYRNIPDKRSQNIYLHICALHRFGVPVRAGLLRRLANATFSEFPDLLKPCELIIVEEHDDRLDEYLYRARHPHIADMVCNYVFSDGNNILDVYLSIFEKMDLGYSSDRHSFRQLIQKHDITRKIPDIKQRRLFFDKALILAGDDPTVYQHYGLMELYAGNLDEAERYIGASRKLDSKNEVYQHSYAILLARKAQNSKNPTAAAKYFSDSQDVLTRLMRSSPSNFYAHNTYAQNLIHKANDRQLSISQRNQYLAEAHEVLMLALRVCHNKSQLQQTLASVLQEVGDISAAKDYAYESHKTNPSNVRTALFLARLLYRNKQYQESLAVIDETLSYDSQHPMLNSFAAKVLLAFEANNHEKIIRYLKRCYDRNFIDLEANFLLAVEYFRAQKYAEAEEIFDVFRKRSDLKRDPQTYDIREYLLDEKGAKRSFAGTVESAYPTYGSIRVDLLAKSIFFPPKNSKLEIGKRVNFVIGFNLLGPIAQNVRPS